ncbi:MAG: MarR family winged helix-turn-helix transcriptional regulator [Nocardioides sp.]|nr:MarR family winged helix-turn-helix transcriptional regulator [Nocardioides sp.]
MIDDDMAGRILSEMVQVSRTFRTAGQRSGDEGVSGTRFGFLQHLRDQDARPGELAHRLLVSAPVASRTIDTLEADGMVERGIDPQDARACLVSITDRGRAKLTESESGTVRKFAEALADWSQADGTQALSILERLNNHLCEVTQPSGSETAGQMRGLRETKNEEEECR